MLERDFVRGQNVAGLTAINSDTDPAALTGAAASAYLKNDNVIAVPAGEASAKPKRLGIAPVYVGEGSAPATTASVYVWESEAQLWMPIATGVTLTYGRATWVDIPAGAKGGEYAVVIAADTPPDGTYATFLGFDYVGGSASESTLASVSTKLTDGTQVAKRPGRVARTAHVASGLLANDGSFTNQAAYPIPNGVQFVAFRVKYTAGAAAGRLRIRPVVGDGTDECAAPTLSSTIADGSAGSPYATQAIFATELTGPQPGNGNTIEFGITLDVRGGWSTCRLLVAEADATKATPGTCEITLTAGY